MRRVLAAAALVVAAPCVAHVTIGGTMDAYLERTSVPGQAATRLESSGLGVSKLGFRSVEPLGGDLVASAYLEGSIGVDTGASGSGFVGRMSYLRLAHPVASLTVGKQYSPHLLQLAAEYDIYATSFWATPYAFFQGAQRYMLIPDAVNLELNLSQRLKLTGMWAQRAQDAAAPRGQQRFLSAWYTVDPQLHVGLSVVDDRHYANLSPRARLWLAGFNYEAGGLRIAGGIQTITRTSGQNRINEHVLGAGYWITAADLVQVNYAKSYEPGAPGRHALVFGIALVHNLSKRTALYSGWGRLNNGAAQDSAFDLPTRPGEAARNLMLGIRHHF